MVYLVVGVDSVASRSRNYNNTVDNSDNTQEVDDDVDTRMSEPGA